MSQDQPILLAGVGPHARRFYLPAIAALGPRYGVRLAAVLELDAGREAARQALAENHLEAEVLIVPRFERTMPASARGILDAAVGRLRAAALIVATDPLAHRPYVLWGMEHRLDVLLDKPITTRRARTSRKSPSTRSSFATWSTCATCWADVNSAAPTRPATVSAIARRSGPTSSGNAQR